jgi:hypothetical protein
MRPEPRLTPEQTAKRRADYKRALDQMDYDAEERRAARGFLICYVIFSAAMVSVGLAIALWRLL